jgi:hypothetical protein
MSLPTFTAASFAAVHQAGFGRAYRGAGFDVVDGARSGRRIANPISLVSIS